jgi:hypothetical protein
MREIFKYGSVGRALRKQCLYPEPDRGNIAVLRKGQCKCELYVAGRLAQLLCFRDTE